MPVYFVKTKMHMYGKVAVLRRSPPSLLIMVNGKKCSILYILIIITTRCTNFSNLFWKKLYKFRTILLSTITSFSLYTQQWYTSYIFDNSFWAESGWNCSSIPILLVSCQHNCMTYTTAVCTVKNSWWWTEELSETCRFSFKINLRN
jgi:hypothetical protein